jgi:hypothetical protein
MVTSLLTTAFCLYHDPAANPTGIPTFPPESEPGDNFSLLLQLDDITTPGLTEDVFRELFVMCRKCRKYMTRNVTIFHKCEAIRRDVSVIDLTNED